MEFTKGQRVYVSSSDSRLRGYNGTVTSVGSKYITVVEDFRGKHKFDKETLYDVDWCSFHLEESEDSYKQKKLREERELFISKNLNKLSDSEIEDVFNRINYS